MGLRIKTDDPYEKYKQPGNITPGEIVDWCSNIPEGRDCEPLDYYDISYYGHRDYNSPYSFRLGDFFAYIPPTFIAVKTITEITPIQGVRKISAIKTKSGYTRKQITVSLVFNGIKQINGYEYDSLIGDGIYYIDGLRSLLAQFKRTPFLPVINEFINDCHDIFVVALSSLTINTVEGFPNCLEAQLVLLEFDISSLTELPPVMFSSQIDWDLFRYYYQQLLTDKEFVYNRPGEKCNFSLKKISNLKTKGFCGDFSFKLLNEEVLDGYTNKKLDLTNDENYIKFVDQDDEISLSNIFCGYQNTLPMIQLSKHKGPIYQYFGGTDSVMTLIFETQSRDVLTSFTMLTKESQNMVRNYNKLFGLGFIKIDNELIQLLGSNYVMISNIETSTVPDFPDLFRIQVECISYDIGQNKYEDLIGFKPFDGDGILNNRENGDSKDEVPNGTITNTCKGLITKILQDQYALKKMDTVDLYPDLQLPKFCELDLIISEIKKIRGNDYKYGTLDREYPLSSYPKEQERDLANYSDPDFYVFYPVRYRNSKGVKAYVPDLDIPDISVSSTSSSSINSYTGASEVNGNITRNEIIERAKFWMDKGIKYNQSGTYKDPQGKSYRTDCSGYVSMAWHLDISRATWSSNSLASISTKISKNQLGGGDLIMASGSNGHALLFEKWTDSSMTYFWGYDFGNTPVKYREMPYPYYNNGKQFYPYRYNKVVDSTNISTTSATMDGKNPTYQEIYDYIVNMCIKYNIPPRIGLATAWTESKWTMWYKKGSTWTSFDNGVATGIMQIENVHKDLVFNGITYQKASTDWKANIEMGVGSMLQEAYKKAVYKKSPNLPSATYCLYQQGINGNIDRWRSMTDKRDVNFKKYYDGQPWIKLCNAKSYENYANETNIGLSTPNINKKYATINSDVLNIDKKRFGKPVHQISNLMDGMKETKDFNTHKQDGYPIERMCVDMATYNKRGRLLRAFPTYSLLLLDENSDWLDGRKLWTNYYLYGSIMNISVHRTRQNPVSTATIQITNIYNNLSNPNTPRDIDYVKIDKDKEGGFIGWMYNVFGISLGTPKVTNEMVVDHNKIATHFKLQSGCRIHLRLGYGNSFSLLPTTFTGTIAEMSPGEIITLVAQSDGAELINNIVGRGDKDDTNGLLTLGTEPSLIIKNLLCDREENTISYINNEWFENSAYGIQHFGTPTLIDDTGRVIPKIEDDIVKQEYLKITEMMLGTDAEKKKRIELIDDVIHSDNTLDILNTLMTRVVDNGFSKIDESLKDMATIILGTTSNIAGAKAITSFAQWVFRYFNGSTGNKTWPQYYDIIKNVYLGSVQDDEGISEDYPAIHFNLTGTNSIGVTLDELNPFSKENLQMYTYNKTPWDIMQISAQSLPEFIAQPHYHMFDNTFFFGHPFWLCSYEYRFMNHNIIEYSKPFAQFHVYDSLCDIIDNQITVDASNFYTNVIGAYTLGNEAKTTPALYADRDISWGNQKTNIVDTSFVRDWPGPDFIYDYMNLGTAKNVAIRIALSNLVDNFRTQYTGNLIIIGDSAVKPCDIVGINDSYINMNGICEVREVLHTFGSDTGFITAITPDMYATPSGFKMKASAQAVLLPLSLAFANARQERLTCMRSCDAVLRYLKLGSAVTMGTLASRVAYEIWTGFRYVKFVDGIKGIADGIKTAKTFLKAEKAAQGVGGIKNIALIAKSAKVGSSAVRLGATSIGSAVAPGIGTIVGFIASTILINTLLSAAESLIDYFLYENVMKCMPMMYNNSLLISGVTGHTKLVPGWTWKGRLYDDIKYTNSVKKQEYKMNYLYKEGSRKMEDLYQKNGKITCSDINKIAKEQAKKTKKKEEDIKKVYAYLAQSYDPSEPPTIVDIVNGADEMIKLPTFDEVVKGAKDVADEIWESLFGG